MRRTFSLPRLAIVVAWAAFAPHSSWSELLPTAIMPDFSTLPSGDSGPWNSWAWNYGPSTAAESYLRGGAALVEAEGAYNYHTALAQTQGEEAYAKSIANRRSAVDTYYQLKQTHAAWQDQNAAPRHSAQAKVRIQNAGTPAGLSRRHVDPVSGAIRWPAALTQTQFDVARQSVDNAWARRDGSPERTRQIEVAVARLETALRGQIRAVSPSDYIAARKLLTSLSHEARETPLEQTL